MSPVREPPKHARGQQEEQRELPALVSHDPTRLEDGEVRELGRGGGADEREGCPGEQAGQDSMESERAIDGEERGDRPEPAHRLDPDIERRQQTGSQDFHSLPRRDGLESGSGIEEAQHHGPEFQHVRDLHALARGDDVVQQWREQQQRPRGRHHPHYGADALAGQCREDEGEREEEAQVEQDEVVENHERRRGGEVDESDRAVRAERAFEQVAREHHCQEGRGQVAPRQTGAFCFMDDRAEGLLQVRKLQWSGPLTRSREPSRCRAFVERHAARLPSAAPIVVS